MLLIHSASFPSVSDARKIRGGLNGFWFGVTNKGRSHNLGKLIKSVSSLIKRKRITYFASSTSFDPLLILRRIQLELLVSM